MEKDSDVRGSGWLNKSREQVTAMASWDKNFHERVGSIEADSNLSLFWTCQTFESPHDWGFHAAIGGNEIP